MIWKVCKKPLKTAAEQRHFSTVQYWFLPLTYLFAKTGFNILWSLSGGISHLMSCAVSFDTIDKPVVLSLVTWFGSKSESATKICVLEHCCLYWPKAEWGTNGAGLEWGAQSQGCSSSSTCTKKKRDEHSIDLVQQYFCLQTERVPRNKKLQYIQSTSWCTPMRQNFKGKRHSEKFSKSLDKIKEISLCEMWKSEREITIVNIVHCFG